MHRFSVFKNEQEQKELSMTYKARNTPTRLPARRPARDVGFFKHTISSLAQHTSATTWAIGNTIFFKTVTFPSRRFVDSHAIEASVVASHVARLIALALVYFAVNTITVTKHYQINICQLLLAFWVKGTCPG